MYNVGIIGMGIGEKHALAYERHPMCVLKALCEFYSGFIYNPNCTSAGCL